MNARNSIAILAAAIFIAGCASSPEVHEPSTEYEDSTAKTPTYKCPSGYVLSCESKKVGRIRFGRMGNKNLDSCSCNVFQGIPTQSPLPGIY